MKNLGTSILILCLNERIAASLAKGLADCLGLHFASAKEIVSYDLFDPEAILQKCGKTYFRQREKASLKGLSNYEDSVIFVNYDLFINNKTIFKRIHPKVYLKLAKRKLDKKDDVISIIAFEERDKLLQEKSDLTVEISGDGKANLKKILKELGTKL